jgi:predicted dehydrogenase
MMLSTVESAVPPSTARADLVTAIIGGGRISEQHLSALRRIGDVEVAGICDLSPALARFMEERFGVAGWYTDYRMMLDRSGANVVHVLTPPATHVGIVRDCLERGCHVIVEKPVALSLVEFRQMWDLSVLHGVRLIENHNYRFNEPIQRVARAIAAGRIGDVQEVEVRMVLNIRAGGRYADENLPHPSHQLPAGVVHEFITHLAYLLLYFMPDDAMEQADAIRAAWRNHGGGGLFKYDDLDATIIAGGVHGRMRFACGQYPDCLSVQVRGSRGVAAAELFHPVAHLTTSRSTSRHLAPLVNALAEAGTRTLSGFKDVWGKLRNWTAYEGLTTFLQRSYAALRTGDEPPVTFEQMDGASRLIDALVAPENRL